MTVKIVKAEQKIKLAMLENGWEKGEVEAAIVCFSYGTWYIHPNGKMMFPIGRNTKEAIEKLESDWELKQEGAI